MIVLLVSSAPLLSRAQPPTAFPAGCPPVEPSSSQEASPFDDEVPEDPPPGEEDDPGDGDWDREGQPDNSSGPFGAGEEQLQA